MKTFVIAKALVVNDANEVLLLKRSKTDTRRPGQWDLPGGHPEPGEDMIVALKREVKEEAGIEIGECDLVFATTEVLEEYGSATWLAFLTRVTGWPPVTLSFEHDESIWLPFDQAIEQLEYERQQRMLCYVHDHGLLRDNV